MSRAFHRVPLPSMAARLLSALLIALLVASAHADTWQCASLRAVGSRNLMFPAGALATDCYGCLSADPSCEWCPSSKQCASGTLTCSVSVYSFGDSDSCASPALSPAPLIARRPLQRHVS